MVHRSTRSRPAPALRWFAAAVCATLAACGIQVADPGKDPNPRATVLAAGTRGGRAEVQPNVHSDMTDTNATDPRPTTAGSAQRVPEIDTRAPQKIQTATFALG